MWVSLPADHPLATRHAIDLADLRDEDWMLACLTGTCADSNVVLRACRDAGFQPRIAYPPTTTSRSRASWPAGWASR